MNHDHVEPNPFACHMTQSLNVRMTLGSIPQDGLTALIIAVKEGHTETVRTLLAVRPDVNLCEKVKQM